MRILTILLLAMLFVTALVVAQSDRQSTSPSDLSVQEPFIKTTQENTFTTSPVLPDCYTYAVERGDPKTGPSVTLSKLAAGCKVPWHTHSANAQVLFVSGTFQLTMKGQEAQILSQGSYAYVPAKHQHQESCLDACTYYVVREGPADVHYVDAQGKEISPEVALAAVGERPPAAEPTR
jgi:quercetin dioxygenase-like cupin family protein